MLTRTHSQAYTHRHIWTHTHTLPPHAYTVKHTHIDAYMHRKPETERVGVLAKGTTPSLHAGGSEACRILEVVQVLPGAVSKARSTLQHSGFPGDPSTQY